MYEREIAFEIITNRVRFESARISVWNKITVEQAAMGYID